MKRRGPTPGRRSAAPKDAARNQSPLRRYREKRDPADTPEPFGAESGATRSAAAEGVFVVQQHAARRMHWDLRLEISGVLVSWAVPRGPSTDPTQRRLAVQTEDHPLEYAAFEGVIPAGNYGAGAMIIWDRGRYRTVSGAPAADGLAAGKLDVDLSGFKLRGRWALVRIKGEDGKSWLLIKKGRGLPSATEPVATAPESVLSGLTVAELREGVQRTAALADQARAAGARRAMQDGSAVRPMLAETAAHPFSKEGWVYEVKYDGVRILAARDSPGPVRLSYRSGRDATPVFPEIARAVAQLPCDQFLMDGEICALDERGVGSFELLQQRLGLDAGAAARAAEARPVVMFCFDLLTVAGYDVRRLPLLTRKTLLQRLVPPRGMLSFAEHFTGDGVALFRTLEEFGLEGIVAKRAASTYQSGRRSRDWLKIKAHRTADLAILGFVRGKGSRRALGSLMVAWRQDGELLYAGNVGTGLDAATIDSLLPHLAAARRARATFRGTPPGPARGNVFVEPRMVAEVRYREVTTRGILRQPVFVRLRDDKRINDCDPPPARPIVAGAARPRAPGHARPTAALTLSNLDKVFWPQDGYTKGDLLSYYEAIWPALAPYLRDRPVVLTRYPDGIEGKGFFQKDAPEFTPDWVDTCRIEDKDYFICNTLRTLLYVINSGCIPLHVWSARRGRLDHPDWAVVDLDPKGAPFGYVVELARHLHALLEDLHVPNFVKTSGQDGLHVLVPLAGSLTHTEARMFAELLARLAATERPALATVARPLGARGGKVYLDYLQNGFGKTIAAPFSVRPRPGAPVSMPLSWRAVTPRLDPGRFTIQTVPGRMRRRADPMRSVLTSTADVPAALLALAKRLS